MGRERNRDSAWPADIKQKMEQKNTRARKIFYFCPDSVRKKIFGEAGRKLFMALFCFLLFFFFHPLFIWGAQLKMQTPVAPWPVSLCWLFFEFKFFEFLAVFTEISTNTIYTWSIISRSINQLLAFRNIERTPKASFFFFKARKIVPQKNSFPGRRSAIKNVFTETTPPPRHKKKKHFRPFSESGHVHGVEWKNWIEA